MSKDKSHKKDKSKKHDLFALMLEQSEVFREMVAHFHDAWAPKKLLNKLEEVIHAGPVAEAVVAKKPKRAARSAKKPVAKVAPAAKKPAAATRKSNVKKASAVKSAKPVVAKKSAASPARRPARKISPKK